MASVLRRLACRRRAAPCQRSDVSAEHLFTGGGETAPATGASFPGPRGWRASLPVSSKSIHSMLVAHDSAAWCRAARGGRVKPEWAAYGAIWCAAAPAAGHGTATLGFCRPFRRRCRTRCWRYSLLDSYRLGVIVFTFLRADGKSDQRWLGGRSGMLLCSSSSNYKHDHSGIRVLHDLCAVGTMRRKCGCMQWVHWPMVLSGRVCNYSYRHPWNFVLWRIQDQRKYYLHIFERGVWVGG